MTSIKERWVNQLPINKNGAVTDFRGDVFEDAPIDGNVYGRQDGEWVIVSGAGGDGYPKQLGYAGI